MTDFLMRFSVMTIGVNVPVSFYVAWLYWPARWWCFMFGEVVILFFLIGWELGRLRSVGEL